MRVLYSSMRTIGRIRPLFPYAHALLKLGHDVLVAAPRTPPRQCHAAFGHPGDMMLAEISTRFATTTAEDVAETAVREIFVGLNAPAALPGLASAAATDAPNSID